MSCPICEKPIRGTTWVQAHDPVLGEGSLRVPGDSTVTILGQDAHERCAEGLSCLNCADTGEVRVPYRINGTNVIRVRTENCPACCPHDEHDNGICIDCGEDRTDHLAGSAESAFEGER